MMKYAVIFASVLCLAYCQRPPYAGSSNRYPVVLPQFLDGQPGAAPADIGSRIDANGSNAMPGTVVTTSTIPPDLPVDAHGDVDLVNRIKTWPREKQPFWFINWQQIQEHRGDTNRQQQTVQAQPASRSFFAG